MNTANLTPAQRQQRCNIRNFFMLATETELQKEIAYRESRKMSNGQYDLFGIECLREMLTELQAENSGK